MAATLDHERVRAQLEAAGCITADAEALELRRAAPDDATLRSWIQRRMDGEPLAWITGSTTFCGRRILIDPGVYVPRWQTEALARRAADVLPRDGGRAVDLCTGSGAVAAHLAAEAPDAIVIATDLDVRSARCARRNGVIAIVADLGEPIRSTSADVVTAVAPYVPTASIDLLPSDVRPFEPRLALDGGRDGLDIVHRAAITAARLLRPAGWFLTEIGGDQADILHDVLVRLGFGEIDPWYDDEGDLRGIAAQTTHRTS
ncbi:MAG TPA: HemK family protein methyltransferase [Ilumatobacteraceae bacterium]|nr:HemK family protein methyltransferase [Ilumatobacteraceae bacterium]